MKENTGNSEYSVWIVLSGWNHEKNELTPKKSQDGVQKKPGTVCSSAVWRSGELVFWPENAQKEKLLYFFLDFLSLADWG